MIKKINLFVFCFAFLLGTGVYSLQIEENKKNILSKRFMGRWVIDRILTKRLTGRSYGFIEKLSISINPEVIREIPDRFKKYIPREKFKIYQAGTLEVWGKKIKKGLKASFLLGVMNGNTMLVFLIKNKKGKIADMEGVHISIVLAKDMKNDLLFIGGDQITEPYTALRRTQ